LSSAIRARVSAICLRSALISRSAIASSAATAANSRARRRRVVQPLCAALERRNRLAFADVGRGEVFTVAP
jgi:hypothetical protein